MNFKKTNKPNKKLRVIIVVYYLALQWIIFICH